MLDSKKIGQSGRRMSRRLFLQGTLGAGLAATSSGFARAQTPSGAVQGLVRPGFEPVRDVIAASLASGGDIGCSAAVFIDGEPVVDIWGGFYDQERTRPDHPTAHDESAEDAPEEDAVVVRRGDAEVAEDQDEDEDVVDREGQLDDVAGEEFEPRLVAALHEQPAVEQDRHRDDHRTPLPRHPRTNRPWRSHPRLSHRRPRRCSPSPPRPHRVPGRLLRSHPGLRRPPHPRHKPRRSASAGATRTKKRAGSRASSCPT